jgi:hypothetical protein
MYDPIHAKPNLNGNTSDDFESAYNYQHLESPGDHLIADRRFIHEKCWEAKALLGLLQSALSDALEGG